MCAIMSSKSSELGCRGQQGSMVSSRAVPRPARLCRAGACSPCAPLATNKHQQPSSNCHGGALTSRFDPGQERAPPPRTKHHLHASTSRAARHGPPSRRSGLCNQDTACCLASPSGPARRCSAARCAAERRRGRRRGRARPAAASARCRHRGRALRRGDAGGQGPLKCHRTGAAASKTAAA